ncbi:hypothetical protein NDU88_003518 [Pleurodeles waltl]|uniref:Uncharacterized protein n=1 Tax=Pleurodeles waltl TaxID=8319 RepID=A0AAV7WT89_PLEWA|nr:hypothetical protein NDU88_003518 [Pleurodeles waltl]
MPGTRSTCEVRQSPSTRWQLQQQNENKNLGTGGRMPLSDPGAGEGPACPHITLKGWKSGEPITAALRLVPGHALSTGPRILNKAP